MLDSRWALILYVLGSIGFICSLTWAFVTNWGKLKLDHWLYDKVYDEIISAVELAETVTMHYRNNPKHEEIQYRLAMYEQKKNRTKKLYDANKGKIDNH